MPHRAVLAGRRRPLARWLPPAIAAHGYTIAEQIVTEGAVDGQYYLPPGILERVEQALTRTDSSMLVVDGELHVGHLADLQERLAGTEIHDRRSIVWAWFRESNPIAETRLAYRLARLERRVAERAGANHRSPAGSSGRVADLDRQCDRLREQLERRKQAERERVATRYTDVDAYAVVATEIGEATQVHSGGLSGECDQLQVKTTVVPIGIHEVAVTGIPPLPWVGGVPDWFETVVPGMEIAIERADFVCSSNGEIATHLASRGEAESVILAPSDTANALGAALTDRLTSVALEVAVPYTDEGHAIVSWLHDRADVTAVAYQERISLSLVAPERAVDAIEQRVQRVAGSLERAPALDIKEM